MNYDTIEITGSMSFDEAVRQVCIALAAAREAGQRRVLVDLSGLRGVAPPSVSQRYFMARAGAEAAGPGMRVSIVSPPELFDPQKFGMMVARNAGADMNVFTRRSEAREWLLHEDGVGD